MISDMELHTVASLLRRGHSLDQLSTGLTLLGALLGLGQWLVGVIDPWLLLLSVALLVLGVLEKYWALRVAFDADLFQRMADSTQSLAERTYTLDQALISLGLQPAARAGRLWTERRHGALLLLRRQSRLLAVQVVLVLGFILASPWLASSI
ncbi:hypothetical protein SAMN03159443_04552 [Pseudomonas sp. NFACC15-1]|uniref:hypothetical protein n=1 Tax=Pseudomonas TaxID=286 RepID=UPI00087F8D5E|nr:MULTISPECIES: hypothetical protein [Pseudomonas]TCV57595.1 hypothetical protein EDB98_12861 [Pseudomonas fluorescens]SDA91176.1 hypothetical protein SAMN03159443_04552 [Pseudomonas sp. NFACC15-1]SDB62702.1 hypothetical protein SAMN03159290_05221 [Pseudomonas sp. NFACC13-1]SDZ01463.1 hypothetical protein SAMN03159380_05206 [Pseudomonas sp. NFACC14]